MRNVVVGVDGTEESAAALMWAAATVGTGGRLHAVVAVNPLAESFITAISGREMSFREVLERDLAHTWTADAGWAVGELETSVSEHRIDTALESAATADDADAIVIGRHHGVGDLGAGIKRIGHTTNRLLRTAHHPVIVVPPGEFAPLETGDVVVGIGHGDATRSAVRWAAKLALTRGVGLELLHATGDAPVFQAAGPGELAKHELGLEDPDEAERERLEHFAAVAAVIAGPSVDVKLSSPPGLAALRLDEASEHAALIVLGRHRSRLDAGHHTAQPLRHVLTHAQCPVAVIADHSTAAP